MFFEKLIYNIYSIINIILILFLQVTFIDYNYNNI